MGDAYSRLKIAEEEMRIGVVHFEFTPGTVTKLYSADLSSKLLKVSPKGKTESIGEFVPQSKLPAVVGFEIGNPIGSYELRRNHPKLDFVAFTWLDGGCKFYSSDQINLLSYLVQ